MKRTPQPDDASECKPIADKIACSLDADVMLVAGGIMPPVELDLMMETSEHRRKNVMLVLSTYGGSGDTAYRITRHLQQSYPNGEFILFVPFMCKSAGTLIAVGAHQIVMADTAELGPLDVQILKIDEVGERHSGLTPSQTLNTLKIEAFNLFEHTFQKLRDKFKFTTRVAASIAADISVGLLSPIYEQIDPMRLGEIERAMMVAAEYGERLKTENVKSDAITRLLTGYPSHGFVIDRLEARTLFSDVREPTADELRLIYRAYPILTEGQMRAEKGQSACVLLLSTPVQPVADKMTGAPTNDHSTKTSAATPNSGGQSDSPSGEAKPEQP